MKRFDEAVVPLGKAREVLVAEKKVADVGRVDCLLADCYVELKSGHEAFGAGLGSICLPEPASGRLCFSQDPVYP